MLRLFLNRRSIRAYKRQSIERDKVDMILTAGLLAPTSRNRQPWQFLVVDNPSLLFDLSKAKAQGSDFIKDAPAAIVVIGDKELSDVWVEDTSIAMAYMQLEAERLGLGSCWVQIRQRKDNLARSSEEVVASLLAIPEKYGVEAILTLGYKGEEKLPRNQEDIAQEKVHYNQFGIHYPGRYV